jgi:hypothetical protein
MPLPIRLGWYTAAFILILGSFLIPKGFFNEEPFAMLYFGGLLALLGPFLPHDTSPYCACCKAREGKLDRFGDPVELHKWEKGGTFYLCSACHAAAGVVLGGYERADFTRCALHDRKI